MRNSVLLVLLCAVIVCFTVDYALTYFAGQEDKQEEVWHKKSAAIHERIRKAVANGTFTEEMEKEAAAEDHKVLEEWIAYVRSKQER